MVITVSGVREREGARFVEFSCSVGAAMARWCGPEPAIGDTRDVELSCDELLSRGRNLVVERVPGAPGVRLGPDGFVEITAQVLSIYEEGSALLGFGDGRLDVEVEAGTSLALDAWYVVRIGSLALFDSKL